MLSNVRIVEVVSIQNELYCYQLVLLEQMPLSVEFAVKIKQNIL